jgi:hypothetical protein
MDNETIIQLLKLAMMVAPWLADLIRHGLDTGIVPGELAKEVEAIMPKGGESEEFVKTHVPPVP